MLYKYMTTVLGRFRALWRVCDPVGHLNRVRAVVEGQRNDFSVDFNRLTPAIATEVMTKPALAVSASMNVKYAIRLLSRVGINRALVTSGDELVGLVTLRDMVIGYVGGAEADE